MNYAPYKIKSIIDCRIWDKITEVYNECLNGYYKIIHLADGDISQHARWILFLCPI